LFLSVIAGVALQGRFPTSDNAMFEYVGRALTHHRVLYKDVWDNKLPGVYFVDAALQFAFGQNYLLHAVAEICIAFASGTLMATIMRSFGLRAWLPGMTALCALLCTVFPLNSTETYALPLLLAAILAAHRSLPALSGLLIAVATIFWIPSLLTIFPIAMLVPRSRWPSLCLAMLVMLFAMVGAFVWSLHLDGLMTLLRSWADYALTPPPIESHRHIPLLNKVPMLWTSAVLFWKGMVSSGAGLLVVILLGTMRKPSTAAQRFGIVWTVAMLAATITGTRFYWHYFVAADAAIIFTIAAYGARSLSNVISLSTIAVSIVLGVQMVKDRRVYWITTNAESTVVARVGNEIRPAVERRLTVQVDSYQPGLYLALNPKLRSPYEIAAPANPKFLHGLQRTLTYPDLKANTHGQMESGVPICARTAFPWRVFAAPGVASQFASCP
jgi:hypothetical protein